MQSRRRSVKEAMVNIGIGFTINYAANIVVLPVLWDGHNKYAAGLYIGIAFTLISFVRQYVIRRWFTKGDSIVR